MWIAAGTLLLQSTHDETNCAATKAKTEEILLSLLPQRAEILLDLRLRFPDLSCLHAREPVGDQW